MAFFSLSDSSTSSASDEENVDKEFLAPAPIPKETVKNAEELRFRVELEFVQMLASPSYLHYLAMYEYLEEDAFLEYLDYLRYWNRSEYKLLLEYPECLHFLDKLLTDPQFRTRLKIPITSDQLHHEQFYRWRNRLFEIGNVRRFQPPHESETAVRTELAPPIKQHGLHNFPILDQPPS